VARGEVAVGVADELTVRRVPRTGAICALALALAATVLAFTLR
jgi:hypothetical protein